MTEEILVAVDGRGRVDLRDFGGRLPSFYRGQRAADGTVTLTPVKNLGERYTPVRKPVVEVVEDPAAPESGRGMLDPESLRRALATRYRVTQRGHEPR